MRWVFRGYLNIGRISGDKRLPILYINGIGYSNFKGMQSDYGFSDEVLMLLRLRYGEISSMVCSEFGFIDIEVG
jgi:hypothetical protein